MTYIVEQEFTYESGDSRQGIYEFGSLQTALRTASIFVDDNVPDTVKFIHVTVWDVEGEEFVLDLMFNHVCGWWAL